MKVWQLDQLANTFFIQFQRFDLMQLSLLGNPIFWRFWQRQLAKTVFNHAFPNRNNAQINLVIGVAYNLNRSMRKSRIRADVPKEYMCVQKQVHTPKSRKISSGNGSSNPSGTLNFSLLRPCGRRDFWTWFLWCKNSIKSNASDRFSGGSDRSFSMIASSFFTIGIYNVIRRNIPGDS